MTEIAWQPSCDLSNLRLRARLLASTRKFFSLRSVLEVETPLLAPTTGTDPQLAFFETCSSISAAQQRLFLQTSPEFAMKRLLAAGSGNIYQICKAFRKGEAGRFHNPEFTLLEWYRVGYDLEELMDEVEQLFVWWFAPYLPLLPAQKISYSSIFARYTGLDALIFDFDAYSAYALSQQLVDAIRLCGHDHATWLDYLFSHQVQPYLGVKRLDMIYNYPACQAALARISAKDSRVAERVELFMEGVELGNGYFELTDAREQASRFDAELQMRQQRKLPAVEKDVKFLAALRSGLPPCAGIAIGLDRVLMLLAKSTVMDDVLAFPQHRI